MYKLNKKDKKTLSYLGYPESDFEQIEIAINKCSYKNSKDTNITYTTAIRLLGKVDFLSGISRAAFHWTATRMNKEGKVVRFNCSSMFK